MERSSFAQFDFRAFIDNYRGKSEKGSFSHFFDAATDKGSDGGNKITHRELRYINNETNPGYWMTGALLREAAEFEKYGLHGPDRYGVHIESAESAGGSRITREERFVEDTNRVKFLFDREYVQKGLASPLLEIRILTPGEMTILGHIVDLLGGDRQKFESTHIYIIRTDSFVPSKGGVGYSYLDDLQYIITETKYYLPDYAMPSSVTVDTGYPNRGKSGILNLKQYFAHEGTHTLQQANIVEFRQGVKGDSNNDYNPDPELAAGATVNELGLEDQAVWVERLLA